MRMRRQAGANHREIANTILDQMGGMRRLQMMIGAKRFIVNTLPEKGYLGGVIIHFPQPDKGKPNVVRIDLHESDTYRVEFVYARGYSEKVLKSYDNVYADQLRSLFERNTGLYLRLARQRQANSNLFGYDTSSDIEVLFDPFQGIIQVGMGGEWWLGVVKMGRNILRHRKERVDPAYKPVQVNVRKLGHGLAFDIMGGFGGGATFSLNFNSK